jgi:hypothetical protein
LGDYYGPTFGIRKFYTGAAFDTWDSTGTRSRDVNVCRATLWMTTWTPRGVTVGDDGRLGLDPWQEESVASLA